MKIEDYIEELTAQERVAFQKICRKLLKHTFIVRDMDESSKREYFFLYRNRDLFEAYLGLMGFDVVLDAAMGVVMLSNQAAYGSTGGTQANRVILKKRESILLCCLWLLYSQRMVDGSSSMSIVVEKAELDSQLEQFGAAGLFDKSAMTKGLEVFARYHLLKIAGKVGDMDCKLVLYPSLQFCMEEEAFAQFVESTVNRMREPDTLLMEEMEDVEEDDE